MPGFLSAIGSSNYNFFQQENREHLLVEEISRTDYYVGRRTLKKFLHDKPFYDDDKYFLTVEGVVLNRQAFIEQLNAVNFVNAIISAYENGNETFFKDFRGSFSGIFYDKAKSLWIIYTNHIGDKQVFYTQTTDSVVVGSEPGFVFEYCKRAGISLSLDEEAAYMLLTHGFFIENQTICNEIKKITAGHYLKIQNGEIKEIQYHRFKNQPDYTKSLDEWIDGIDYHFRKAVQLQFEKDVEYNYKHITTLSGGLDSRMTVWIAHELGFTEQLNTTFSQSNYLDEVIAKHIATDLEHEWLFKALDHGNFIKNVEQITQITYGGGAYIGLAHGKSLYDLVNFEKFGLVHTGQIGDAIIGTFYSSGKQDTPFSIGDGANSLALIDKLKNYKFKYQYDNQEIYKLYTRAFNGANQGLLIFQESTESCSPFTDVDFIEFAYSIPVEYRYKHKIYIDWILSKYPKASKYPWERIARIIEPVKSVESIKFLGKSLPRKRIVQWVKAVIERRILNKIVPAKEKKLDARRSMNPIDLWLSNNPSLIKFIELYTKEVNETIEITDIINACNVLLKDNAYNRLLVVSFIEAASLIRSKSIP